MSEHDLRLSVKRALADLVANCSGKENDLRAGHIDKCVELIVEMLQQECKELRHEAQVVGDELSHCEEENAVLRRGWPSYVLIVFDFKPCVQQLGKKTWQWFRDCAYSCIHVAVTPIYCSPATIVLGLVACALFTFILGRLYHQSTLQTPYTADAMSWDLYNSLDGPR